MHHAIFKCVIGATSKQRHARLKYASFNVQNTCPQVHSSGMGGYCLEIESLWW